MRTAESRRGEKLAAEGERGGRKARGHRERTPLGREGKQGEERRGQCISIPAVAGTPHPPAVDPVALFAASERANGQTNGRTNDSWARASERANDSSTFAVNRAYVGAENRKILKNLSPAASLRGTISSMAMCLPPCGIPDVSRRETKNGEKRGCEARPVLHI